MLNIFKRRWGGKIRIVTYQFTDTSYPVHYVEIKCVKDMVANYEMSNGKWIRTSGNDDHCLACSSFKSLEMARKYADEKYKSYLERKKDSRVKSKLKKQPFYISRKISY